MNNDDVSVDELERIEEHLDAEEERKMDAPALERVRKDARLLSLIADNFLTDFNFSTDHELESNRLRERRVVIAEFVSQWFKINERWGDKYPF